MSDMSDMTTFLQSSGTRGIAAKNIYSSSDLQQSLVETSLGPTPRAGNQMRGLVHLR
jgi:hypothetical protein